MIKLNLNPKGIKTGDCVVRAIAYATKKTWEEVYNDLCKIGFKLKRMPNEKQVFEKYLEQLGWKKQKQPRKYNGDKFTIREFLNECYDTNSNTIIISCTNHLTCADINCDKSDIVDTWNCQYRCVCNYWIKE